MLQPYVKILHLCINTFLLLHYILPTSIYHDVKTDRNFRNVCKFIEKEEMKWVGLGSGLEVTGLIPVVCMSECPWARY